MNWVERRKRERRTPRGAKMTNAPTVGTGLYLGIEAGATRTVALLVDEAGTQRGRVEAGPANLRLMDERALRRHFRELSKTLPRPDALAIGMAGARTESDRARLRRAVADVAAWKHVPCHVTNDLETALLADAPPPASGDARGGGGAGRTARQGSQALPDAQVLVLSGTGSCCFGRTKEGGTAKVGGWGHLIGDKGSGYEIGLRALKAVVFYFDRDGEWPVLGRRLLRSLMLNEPNDVIGWAQKASKAEIAALAVEVFKAWAERDWIAADILDGALDSLARDAEACARRLVKPDALVEFVLAGSVILRQPRFCRRLTRAIQGRWKHARVRPLQREGAWGAVALARQLRPAAKRTGFDGQVIKPGAPAPAGTVAVGSTALSPTEERHPRSMNLDRLPLRAAIELMLSEDRKLPGALLAERERIEQGVKLVARSLQRGGRLFYVGAGTSGRLGVLDASECPPTFRTDPEMVQGIIAGGRTALWQAVEGAEDDAEAGAHALAFRGVQRRDTVVGIAASGRTPFVWGALREAKRRGAATILLCFNPNLSIPRALRPTLVLTPRIGPEILTGSTRLKAGTATKLILNIFTTLAMVRVGKVLGNLMIDVNASNSKLRERAIRIVRELTGADASAAQAALQRAGWKIRGACARLGRRAAPSQRRDGTSRRRSRRRPAP
jgi:N-acetylmuramic acid 6-phosphate etherase